MNKVDTISQPKANEKLQTVSISKEMILKYGKLIMPDMLKPFLKLVSREKSYYEPTERKAALQKFIDFLKSPTRNSLISPAMDNEPYVLVGIRYGRLLGGTSDDGIWRDYNGEDHYLNDGGLCSLEVDNHGNGIERELVIFEKNKDTNMMTLYSDISKSQYFNTSDVVHHFAVPARLFSDEVLEKTGWKDN